MALVAYHRSMTDVQRGTQDARRRKMFSHADAIGLDRVERIELARVLLWRDVTSWKDLDDAQVDRMLDALEGWMVVEWLLKNRGTTNSLPGPAGRSSMSSPQTRDRGQPLSRQPPDAS